jgi:hypothetical protein
VIGTFSSFVADAADWLERGLELKRLIHAEGI